MEKMKNIKSFFLPIISVYLILVFLSIVVEGFVFFEFIGIFIPHYFLLNWVIILVLFIIISKKKSGISFLRKSTDFKQKLVVVIFLIILFFNLTIGLNIISFYYVKPKLIESEKKSKEITVGFFNKLYSNNNYAEINSNLERLDFDILGLSEFNEYDKGKISKLQDYKYSLISNCKCKPFQMEIALFSKYEILEHEFYNFSEGPIIRANIKVSDEIIEVFVTHPASPVSQEKIKLRNERLNDIKNVIQSRTIENGNYLGILMGDMNITNWSPTYSKTIGDLDRFYNSSKGLGLKFSWPVINGIPFWVVKIDHIFVTENIETTDFYTLPINGADHQMIYANLRI